jgi:hypothetical protein
MTTLSKLEEFANDDSQPSATRRIAGSLASAINDWPTFELVSLDAYLLELRREVGDVLTWANVRAKLDSYTFEDAWKAESLCGLLNAWDIPDREVVLDELVIRIGLDV